MMRVERAALERLLHKHREIARLREEHAAGLPPPARPFFAVLAREFPGALRELDRLPPEVLRARTGELEEAVADARVERDDLPAWIEISLAYHATLAAPGVWAARYVVAGDGARPARPIAGAQRRRRVDEVIARISLARGVDPEDIRDVLRGKPPR